MADTTSAPNMSAPFNPLVQANLAPAPNPLTVASQAAQTQTALTNAQTAGLQLNDEQLANAQNHVAFRINAITPLLAKGNNVTTNDIVNGVNNLVYETKGAFSSAEAAHTITNELPPSPNGDPDAPNPAAAKYLQMQAMRLQDVNSRIATARGQTGAFNNGQGTQFYKTDSFTGAPQMTGFAKGYMSPAEAASPTPGPVNKLTGAATTEPLGQRAEEAGLALPGTYSGQGQSGSGSGPGVIPVTIGANGQIMKRPTAGAGAPPPQASGAIETAPSPAQAAAFKASGDAYAGAQQNMATYAQREQQLQSGLAALRSTNTGPGTESRNSIESYMLALPGGLGRWIPGVDPQSVAEFDTANKYLTAAAAANPSAGRSDAGLSTALASNPSVHISNAAAQDIQKANLGFIRFEKANMSSFGGQDASQWNAHIAQRNQNLDPHAYSADMNTPAQREAYMKSLSPSGKTKYLASVRDAVTNGAFSMSDLQGGAANGR